MRVCYMGALMALPLFSHAQPEPALPLITVTAVKDDPQALATSKTTRISAQQINEQQARNIKDLVRYEPGVSVANNASRFGLSGFNIRGLEGNRILMQVDGVRLGDQFAMGGYSNASRDQVDIELLQTVDLNRGTGSAKDGSDALGGSVSYRTPEPEDVLKGRAVGGVFKTAYQSVDRSWVAVATGAAGHDRVKLLARVVKRAGHESATMGRVDGLGINRTLPNPQQRNGTAALFKMAFTPTAHARTELAYQRSGRDVDTHVLSQIVGGLAKDMHAQDQYRHDQWSLAHRLKDLAGSEVDIKLYRQLGQTEQYTRQDRKPTSSAFSPTLYERYFSFEQDVRGLRLDGLTQISSEAPHLLSWGGDGSVTTTAQLRDGYTTMRNGQMVREVTVDVFPTRDTPRNESMRWSAYLQDEWLVSDVLTLMAGGRFEHHKLTPKPDEIYLANEAAAPAAGARYKNFSPKLATIWSMGGGYALSGQYSRGFRAPPYSDVNIGFANTQAGYTSVANPDLRPEKSEGVELVWQRKLAAGSWSVAVFDNRYRDFIENQMLNCPGDAACSDLVSLTFQSRNVSRVRISGGELKFESMLPAHIVLRGALAYARGRKTDEGKPLDSVNPISGTLGLQQTIGTVKWEFSTTFAQRKKAQDAEKQEASDQLKRQFLTPGYAVADLRVTWLYAKDGTLGIGVHNIFDRLYYHWSDVPVADIHVPDSQAGAERYSQPGRQYTISVQHAF